MRKRSRWKKEIVAQVREKSFFEMVPYDCDRQTQQEAERTQDEKEGAEDMERLDIAVCDDNSITSTYIAEKIKNKFLRHSIQAACEVFQDPRALLGNIEKEQYFQIYFLDISMPFMDGITLAQEILKQQEEALIIFVSARESDIFRTFIVNPFAFIRKENFLQDLENVIEEFCDRYRQEEQICWVQDKNGDYIPLKVGQVLFLEEQDDDVYVMTVQKNFLIRNSLKKLEKSLEEYPFVRTHKSFLVNLMMIYQIKDDKVLLENGIELPLSCFHTRNVRRQFCKYFA